MKMLEIYQNGVLVFSCPAQENMSDESWTKFIDSLFNSKSRFKLTCCPDRETKTEHFEACIIDPSHGPLRFIVKEEK